LAALKILRKNECLEQICIVRINGETEKIVIVPIPAITRGLVVTAFGIIGGETNSLPVIFLRMQRKPMIDRLPILYGCGKMVK